MNSFMKVIDSFKVHRSFLEEVKYEISDLIRSIGDFFIMIKEHTYDPLVVKFGEFAVNLLGIGLGIALIMLVCMFFINR